MNAGDGDIVGAATIGMLKASVSVVVMVGFSVPPGATWNGPESLRMMATSPVGPPWPVERVASGVNRPGEGRTIRAANRDVAWGW